MKSLIENLNDHGVPVAAISAETDISSARIYNLMNDKKCRFDSKEVEAVENLANKLLGFKTAFLSFKKDYEIQHFGGQVIEMVFLGFGGEAGPKRKGKKS